MLTNIFYNAKATIKGSSSYPDIKGSVIFKKCRNGILVTAKIKGLPQGNIKGRFFGFHIHEGATCTGNKEDEFADTKNHLSLIDFPHPFHTGDLPPLIENNGYAYMSVLVNKFKIEDILGKVVVIHDMPDDFKSQPSGNSGAKIVCGVIK